ncbi:MAG: hypothetical protein ACRD3Q_01820, partial [Terriglobales bacterium]
DIAKPSLALGYLVLAASPAAGCSLEWDGAGTGTLNQHSDFRGNTIWPNWLKLQRHGHHFTGFASLDGVNWYRIGEAEIPSADANLDVGIFAFRSSARFDHWTIEP